ncbi:hypothetical protein E3U43_018880 [Larimichthys crocea]|uniref:Uncharacterized protein n=1 Tax=Larimichthys crocea TaxID=215358 RepID=A0ACD3QWH4_LARCR|nr:hypothetical protein E3U43_018880 [Larimichthys crocea]
MAAPTVKKKMAERPTVLASPCSSQLKTPKCGTAVASRRRLAKQQEEVLHHEVCSAVACRCCERVLTDVVAVMQTPPLTHTKTQTGILVHTHTLYTCPAAHLGLQRTHTHTYTET